MHGLITDSAERDRTNVLAARTERWLTAHPVLGFVLLAYALSWQAWVLAYATGWFPLVVLGGFGPAVAAALTLRLTGQPLRPWLRGLLAWRVRPRFYAYALLLPAGIYGAVNLAVQVLGTDVDWSVLPTRVPGYFAFLLLTAILFGGPEEPGWRGYALPRLQERLLAGAGFIVSGIAYLLDAAWWPAALVVAASVSLVLLVATFTTWWLLALVIDVALAVVALRALGGSR